MISALEHWSYCPRQCALIHVERVWDENLYTLRGRRAHEKVDLSDAELEVFHKEDRMGGGLVVGLMAGIFTIGLLLYITVAIMVVRGV